MFNPKRVDAGFVAEEDEMGEGVLRVLRFSAARIIPSKHHIHSSITDAGQS
jgi:hypothetical protein